jgi:adenosine/AMP kinase
VRSTGTDDACLAIARKNALRLAAGHSFVLFLDGTFPVNVLRAVSQVPEVCQIFCASANPVEVVVAETPQGRGILGVIDGLKPRGLEGEDDVRARKEFLRKIGYKL